MKAISETLPLNEWPIEDLLFMEHLIASYGHNTDKITASRQLETVRAAIKDVKFENIH